MAEYVTVQGEMWDIISLKVYGTEAHMDTLMEANPDHIRTVVFGAGVRLTIPDIAPAAAVDVPPWRRNAT